MGSQIDWTYWLIVLCIVGLAALAICVCVDIMIDAADERRSTQLHIIMTNIQRIHEDIEEIKAVTNKPEWWEATD